MHSFKLSRFLLFINRIVILLLYIVSIVLMITDFILAFVKVGLVYTSNMPGK